MFKIRAVLASMLSPVLGHVRRATSCSSTSPRPGAEEYLDNEKFELRPARLGRRRAPPGASLAPYITRLNAIRRDNPALHWLRNLRFHDDRQRRAAVLVQAGPGDRQHRPGGLLVRLGATCSGATPRWTCRRWAWTGTSGSRCTTSSPARRYEWGQHNAVRLDPYVEPAHVFVVHRARQFDSSTCGWGRWSLMDLTSDLDPSVEHDPAEGSHVEDGVVEHPTADDFGHARTLPADRTWFKRAVFYEVLVRAFYDSNARRLRRPARPDRAARLPAVARRRLPLAAAVLRLAAARRRLRHPRLLQGAARVRHGRRLRRAARRGAQARHPGDHRPGDEPHLGLAPVVPGVAPRPRRPVRRLLRVERHQRASTPTPGSSSSTPRSRTGRSTRCAGSSTGTGSSPTSRT